MTQSIPKGELELRVADIIPMVNPMDSSGYQIEIYVNIFQCTT